MKLRLVLLPGNEWFVYHPQKQVYHASPRGNEYAVLRFDNQVCPVYPLAAYRKELKRPDLEKALALPQPVLKPKAKG